MTRHYLHQHSQFKDLLGIVAEEKQIAAQLVEKDYWVMHALWGLLEQGLNLELKGGTSLSKGFDIIHRFSEDLDVKIEPPTDSKVFSGKNHTKPQHIESRKDFFDDLAKTIDIPDMSVRRDSDYDDYQKMRNAGIRLEYSSLYSPVDGLKEGVLLEVGFDTTQPSYSCDITSWAWERAKSTEIDIHDNRALSVSCYHPGYTFVEKLQTVLSKFRQHKEGEGLKKNFLRHYYDIYQLLHHSEVKNFIGTQEYHAHKKLRFASLSLDLSKAEAFFLSDPKAFSEFDKQYQSTSILYFKRQPSLRQILELLQRHLDKL